ncbi:MAG: hypothetical protein P8X96_12800, partial [Desulfobacteraceae bacterium]
MKSAKQPVIYLLFALLCAFIFVPEMMAAEPIVIGVPTSTGFLEGKECINAAQLAVVEIHAKGGVTVCNQKRPFKIEA